MCRGFLQTRSEYTRKFARLTRDRLDGLPCTSVHPFGTAFENEFSGGRRGSGRTRWTCCGGCWMRRLNWTRACMCITGDIPGAGRTAV
ncbi:MAG: hypothetical protein ACLS6G_10855 [Christensenellales bacterium]